MVPDRPVLRDPPTPAETVRALVERHGATPAGSAALLQEARALTADAPATATALIEAGLAAGLPPTAALHVALSDGWAARGDRVRAARAARRALRAAPDGPHAARMRSRAVPGNPPR